MVSNNRVYGAKDRKFVSFILVLVALHVDLKTTTVYVDHLSYLQLVMSSRPGFLDSTWLHVSNIKYITRASVSTNVSHIGVQNYAVIYCDMICYY